MSSLPQSLEITITKQQPDTSNQTSEQPSKTNTTNTTTTASTTGSKPEKSDQNNNMLLLPPRTPPYQTGAKKEPGTEDEACEEAIASGDATPSWEGVWRKDRRDTKHQGPCGAS